MYAFHKVRNDAVNLKNIWILPIMSYVHTSIKWYCLFKFVNKKKGEGVNLIKYATLDHSTVTYCINTEHVKVPDIHEMTAICTLGLQYSLNTDDVSTLRINQCFSILALSWHFAWYMLILAKSVHVNCKYAV